jgi:GGDEF domain-containing protein
VVLLDRSTLLVVFAVITLTILVLFYFDTYGKSRAPFAGWWCVAVASFFLAAVAYILGESAGILWAPSLGNGVMVLGCGCVWAGVRSLAGRRVRRRLPALPAAAAFAVAFATRSSGDSRVGSIALLARMGSAIGLAAVELWRERARSWHLVRSLAIATAACGFYYLSRVVGLAVLGPESALFQLLFGTGISLLMATIVLVVASSSITALNNARRTEDLQELASRDALTGLLNRGEFMQQAQQRPLANLAAGIPSVIVMADLVGRYGGEEFAMLLTGVEADEGVSIADRINAALAGHSSLPADIPAPTASFGIVGTRTGTVSLQRLIRAAASALYEAKAAGRNRAMVGLSPAGKES